MSAFGPGLLLWGKTKLQSTFSGQSLKIMNNRGSAVGCGQSHANKTMAASSWAGPALLCSPTITLCCPSFHVCSEKRLRKSNAPLLWPQPSSVSCKPLTERKNCSCWKKQLQAWVPKRDQQSCIWSSQQILQFKLWLLRVQHLWKFRPSSQASAKEGTCGCGTATAAWLRLVLGQTPAAQRRTAALPKGAAKGLKRFWASAPAHWFSRSSFLLSSNPTNMLLLFFEKPQPWNAACEYFANWLTWSLDYKSNVGPGSHSS